MTKQQYLNIRNNHNQDVIPALYFYFKLKGGDPNISQAKFNELFSMWLHTTMKILALGDIIKFTFSNLDKYFEIDN